MKRGYLEYTKIDKHFFFIFNPKTKTIQQYTIKDDTYVLFSYSDDDFAESFFTYNGIFQMNVSKTIRFPSNRKTFKKKYQTQQTLDELLDISIKRNGNITFERIVVFKLYEHSEPNTIDVNSLFEYKYNNPTQNEKLIDMTSEELEEYKNNEEIQKMVMNELNKMDPLDLYHNDPIITSKVLGFMTFQLQSTSVKVLYDSKITPLSVESFWNSISSKDKTLTFIEMESGSIFGWYLGYKIPQMKNNCIEYKETQKHLIYFSDKINNRLPQFNVRRNEKISINYKMNMFDVFLDFSGIFQLYTNMKMKIPKMYEFNEIYQTSIYFDELVDLKKSSNGFYDIKRIIVFQSLNYTSDNSIPSDWLGRYDKSSPESIDVVKQQIETEIIMKEKEKKIELEKQKEDDEKKRIEMEKEMEKLKQQEKEKEEEMKRKLEMEKLKQQEQKNHLVPVQTSKTIFSKQSIHSKSDLIKEMIMEQKSPSPQPSNEKQYPIENMKLVDKFRMYDFGKKLMSTVNTNDFKLIYEMSSMSDNNKIDDEKFWKLCSGLDQLMFIIEMENGKTFGFYLHDKIPQPFSNGRIEFYRHYNHFFFSVDDNSNITKYDVIIKDKNSLKYIMANYTPNEMNMVIKFNYMFVMTRYKEFCNNSNDESYLKYNNLNWMNTLNGIEIGKKGKMKEFIVLQLFKTEEKEEIIEIIQEQKEEIINNQNIQEQIQQQKDRIVKIEMNESEKQMKSSIDSKIEQMKRRKDNSLKINLPQIQIKSETYQTGKLMTIGQVKNECLFDYLILITDKILLLLSQSSIATKIMKLTSSNQFKRIYEWTVKNKTPFQFTQEMLNSQKVTILIETEQQSIFGCHFNRISSNQNNSNNSQIESNISEDENENVEENDEYDEMKNNEISEIEKMWFISLKAPKQTDMTICQKKNAINSVYMRKQSGQNCIIVENAFILFNSNVINESGLFQREYNSLFDINMFIEFESKKSIKIKSLQIYHWK